MNAAPRLGFAVKVVGRSDLPSHDTRRWQNEPHLRVSLERLRAIFAYLDEVDIRMYRMVSDLAPYATHPDHPGFHDQVASCEADLAETGALARRLGLRLSFHPSQYIVLNAEDDGVAVRSAADIEVQAAILDRMGLDDEAVVVLHVGGVYGDRTAARERFVRRYEGLLSPPAQRRLVLENDGGRFGVMDVLWIHRRTGVRVVFDAHHFNLHNPDGMEEIESVRAALATWQAWDARPKIHISSPRTDWGYRGYGYGMETDDEGPRTPNWASHAEFVDPFAFITFYRRLLAAQIELLPDVMLEAKAKDVAVLELRRALARHAPDLAALFGPGKSTR